jgi:hypothetical protein
VRAQFNLAPNKINTSCYWQASHPKRVRDAIEQHRRGLDECPSEYFEENASRLETAARSSAAEYLAAKPDEFAMTESTSQRVSVLLTNSDLSSHAVNQLSGVVPDAGFKHGFDVLDVVNSLGRIPFNQDEVSLFARREAPNSILLAEI